MVGEYDGVEEAVPSKKTLIGLEICEAGQASRVLELLYTGDI